MYVIYPAEELLNIYDTHQRGNLSLTNDPSGASQNTNQLKNKNKIKNKNKNKNKNKEKNNNIKSKESGGSSSSSSYWNRINSALRINKNFNNPDNGPVLIDRKFTGNSSLISYFDNRSCGSDINSVKVDPGYYIGLRKPCKEIMQNNRNSTDEGAAANPLKDLTHASLNEPLKLHNANTLKLVQTGQYICLALVSFPV